VNGTVPQDQLDKIDDVMPLRNHALFDLVGKTCVAVVYDSDISINFQPLLGNLQGDRYGLFAFTVLEVIVAGSLDESGSSTSLYDLRVRVEGPQQFTAAYQTPIDEDPPDTVAMPVRTYDNGTMILTVEATSSQSPGAMLTVSVDGVSLEKTMTYNAGTMSYEFSQFSATNLDGRRIAVSSSEGGTFRDLVQ